MRKSEKILYMQKKYHEMGFSVICRICTCVLRIIFSCDIPSTVKMGNGIQLVHNGLGVVIHPQTIIEDNVKIYQNVTLGGNAKLIDGHIINNGAPYIEKNVAIFAGACVLGPVKIGKNSLIGANTVVLKDVPENSVVYGNPCKITPKKNDYNFSQNTSNKE